MEGLIIMEAILSRPHRMASFSRTYINDSMAFMEIILTRNITLTRITFHRVFEKGEKVVFYQKYVLMKAHLTSEMSSI